MRSRIVAGLGITGGWGIAFMGCGLNPTQAKVSPPIGPTICAQIQKQTPTNSIYVAPDGDDNNPGTQKKPFKTLYKAQEKSFSNPSTSDVTVYLRGGVHQLDRPLEFSPRESTRSVIYRAFEREQPIVSGGEVIQDWQPMKNGLYKANVGDRQFRQLYVNDQRAIRARTPNAGKYLQLNTWDLKTETIVVPASDLPKNKLKPSDLKDAEMVIQRDWNQSRLRIEQVKTQGETVAIQPKSPERSRAFKQEFPYKNDQRPYHLENALPFLDAPGEWYLDHQQGEVFYKPRLGEDMAKVTVVAPRLPTLVNIQGRKDQPVQNLAFCGLTFQHSTWLEPNQQGYVGTQAGIPYDSDPATAAIVTTYAKNITFERNRFLHLGGMGISLSIGTHVVDVNANVFTDISDNAVSIGIPINDTQDPPDQIHHVRVRNNYITQIGQDYFGSVGIFAAYASNLTIAHNELTNLPYTAISLGWGWSDADSSLRDNTIEANHIHGVMRLLFDGGAIYTLSKQPGTVISRNYITDMVPAAGVPAGPEQKWLSGIYLDQGSSQMRLEDNVILNVPTKITQQSVAPPAKDNTLINNDADLALVKSRSGIEAAYRDIKSGY
jgi:Right handed beta helix region